MSQKGGGAPQDMALESMGPIVESVLGSLTQEYERRLQEKEHEVSAAQHEVRAAHKALKLAQAELFEAHKTLEDSSNLLPVCSDQPGGAPGRESPSILALAAAWDSVSSMHAVSGTTGARVCVSFAYSGGDFGCESGLGSTTADCRRLLGFAAFCFTVADLRVPEKRLSGSLPLSGAVYSSTGSFAESEAPFQSPSEAPKMLRRLPDHAAFGALCRDDGGGEV